MPRSGAAVFELPQLQRFDRQGLVALEGVDDLVVRGHQDAVAGIAQKMQRLKRCGKAETSPGGHRESSQVIVPGAYQSVDIGERYQVKRIT